MTGLSRCGDLLNTPFERFMFMFDVTGLFVIGGAVVVVAAFIFVSWLFRDVRWFG